MVYSDKSVAIACHVRRKVLLLGRITAEIKDIPYYLFNIIPFSFISLISGVIATSMKSGV